MSKSYLVQKIDDYAYIRNSGDSNFLLSAAEAFELADAIISTALLMLKDTETGANKDMGIYRKEYILSKLSYIFKNNHWAKGNNDLTAITPVVYFLKSAEYPTLIKIGSTKNIIRRPNEVAREHFDEDVEVLYCLFCKNQKEVEHFIHIALEEYRVFGEWFSEEAVLKFIQPYIQKFVEDTEDTNEAA